MVKTLAEFTKEFGITSTPPLFSLRKEHYLHHATLEPIALALQKRHIDVVACGEKLGIEGRQFTPSPALLNWLDTQGAYHISVNDKAAFLFLCGRDVLDVPHKTNNNVIVKDTKDRILGCASLHRNLAKNIWDCGDFLRREMKKPDAARHANKD